MPSIKYKKKTYAGATFPVLEMTKAEYDALPEAKKMDGTVYMITDDTGGWEAENSAYDNSESGLAATNVQDALDELNSKTILFSEEVSSSQLTFGGSDTRWSISSSKTGWAPLMYSSVTNSYSSRVVTNVESVSLTNGQFIANGYGRTPDGASITTTIRLRVLWQKN